jgi:rubrerythrin
MKNLKGTKTEKNLMDAFAGESQARNKYTYYASKAKKEGFEQIANIFTETANNEKNTLKSGSNCCKKAAKLQIRKQTLRMPQTVNDMNGPKCMRTSPRMRAKKALTILPHCFEGVAKNRKGT